ncbi:hypothetical protein [Actinomadura fibrosa]|uniref:Uncharacterized protein n=1 Tax=Actinomadura fibrosa TaxID=111802 RepID=A0ABW2XHP8_9ACTN|nr:hypothetical protein [Actinomadura fibrosa]
MRKHLLQYRITLARLARKVLRQILPGAIVSGASAGATGWLLTLVLHHL